MPTAEALANLFSPANVAGSLFFAVLVGAVARYGVFIANGGSL